MAIRTTFPTMLRYAQFIPIFPLLKSVSEAGQRMFHYAQQAIGRYHNMLENNPVPKPTLFTKMFKSGSDGLTEFEIVLEAGGYIVAGSDTTAITLTYLVWAVCKRPSIRDQLVAELARLPEGFKEEDLRDLPYLNQVRLRNWAECSQIRNLTMALLILRLSKKRCDCIPPYPAPYHELFHQKGPN
jgi:cytochrome P450